MPLTSPDNRRIVGRFAPSPTGPLHLGSLVAALGSYVMARQAGGLWLLRMEDLDDPRVVPGMADDIMRTLEALGFAWDGEVVRQSRRKEAYQEALDDLMGRGLVYACGCSRAEIARIASAPHEGEELLYPGICREGLAEGKEERAWRVIVYDELISFNDRVMGHFSEILTASSGDFVVKRADGPFAYQLAVVVDDHFQGVNQVVRGVDLLSSTPRQIYLQKLLGFKTPSYAHLPLVTGPGGVKLSKRDNALSLAEGRDLKQEGGGLLARALAFLGQEVPVGLELADCREVLAWAVEEFDAMRIPRRGGGFPDLRDQVGFSREECCG